MSDITKIPFSKAEMQLIGDAQVFLTKKVAFEKVVGLLAKIQEEVKSCVEQDHQLRDICAELEYRKISTGENYKQMPYQISDFPARFDKENILTIRCLVWWGNEVSIHLLLKGSFYQSYLPMIAHNITKLSGAFYGCIASTPWEHHFLPDNYLPIQSFNLDPSAEFLKIGKKYALDILTKGTTEIVNDIIILLRLLQQH